MALTQNLHETFHLLRLPIEIRQSIIEYVFLLSCEDWCHTENQPTRISFRGKSNSWKFDRKSSYWGTERMSRILRLNHQIYLESMSILYGGNFIFDFAQVIADPCIDKCLIKSKDYIKHISLTVIRPRTPYTLRLEEALKKIKAMLKCLKTVEIRVMFHRKDQIGPKRAAMRNNKMKEYVIRIGRIFDGPKITLVNGYPNNFQEYLKEHAELLKSCQKALNLPVIDEKTV